MRRGNTVPAQPLGSRARAQAAYPAGRPQAATDAVERWLDAKGFGQAAPGAPANLEDRLRVRSLPCFAGINAAQRLRERAAPEVRLHGWGGAQAYIRKEPMSPLPFRLAVCLMTGRGQLDMAADAAEQVHKEPR